MSTTDQDQYQGEIELAAGVIRGLGGPERQMREDRPELTARLEELTGDAQTLAASLARIQDEMSLVKARLLPDDELTRLAQLARDIRDDNLPDVDAHIPVTPCPEWCEVAGHDGEGKNHEGAISAFHLEGYPGESVVLGVYLTENGEPVASLQADLAMPIKDIARLQGGLERAKQLAIQIEAAR